MSTSGAFRARPSLTVAARLALAWRKKAIGAGQTPADKYPPPVPPSAPRKCPVRQLLGPCPWYAPVLRRRAVGSRQRKLCAATVAAPSWAPAEKRSPMGGHTKTGGPWCLPPHRNTPPLALLPSTPLPGRIPLGGSRGGAPAWAHRAPAPPGALVKPAAGRGAAARPPRPSPPPVTAQLDESMAGGGPAGGPPPPRTRVHTRSARRHTHARPLPPHRTLAPCPPAPTLPCPRPRPATRRRSGGPPPRLSAATAAAPPRNSRGCAPRTRAPPPPPAAAAWQATWGGGVCNTHVRPPHASAAVAGRARVRDQTQRRGGGG